MPYKACDSYYKEDGKINCISLIHHCYMMEYFEHVPEYRLLSCRSCRTMVTQRRIRKHLQGPTHLFGSSLIKEVQKWASKLDVIQDDQELWKKLPLVPDDILPIAALGRPESGGFRCTFVTGDSVGVSTCRYVGRDWRRISEHLRDEHGWHMRLKGGRYGADAIDRDGSRGPWRSGVYYQRFFLTGARSENFEVARGLDLGAVRVGEHVAQAELQQAIDAFQAKANKVRSEEGGRIDAQDDDTDPNAWLRRLGSTLHLKDFSGKKDFLRGLISMEYEDDVDNPDQSDDAQLRFVHMAFNRMIVHAKATITPEVVSWNALFEVNRKELAKERSKPFHFRFKPETQRRYTLVVKQLLAYIVRCLSYEDKKDRPPFKLSRRQQKAHDTMMNHADDLVDAWKENNEDEEAPEVSRLLLLLEDDVLELYISVLDHFTKDTEYDSVLVSFLTVLSIRPDDTWESYANFTPKLSAIMAMSRLCIIKYAVDQRARSIREKKQRGQSQEEAEENSPSNFGLISDMTRRFMVGGGEGWETTPTQFIIRLRNFGMAAHNNTAAPGSISWDKEVVKFKGIRLSVIDVQAMMRTAVQQLENLLYKELLFCDMFPRQTPAEAGVPEIPWDDILDNAADETIGHSFVDKLYQHDGGASKGWLIRKILQEYKLRVTWIKSMDTSTELNTKVAYQYGLQVEKAQELLAYLVHFGGGFPTRAYDLLTIRQRNTANGGVRNILIDKGLVMIVTGVRKGFSMTERLKIIHRFLPREVGTPLVYFLWLVLPFWEDVQANVWERSSFNAGLWGNENEPQSSNTGDDQDLSLRDQAEASQVPSSQDEEQRQSKKWPGKRWTSRRLARIVRRQTLAVCDQKLDISSWRHISTAIGRRYFRDASTAHTKLLPDVESDGSGSESEGDEDSPYDLQAGHGSRIAGLIYGRLVTEGAFETNERRVNFRYISEEWHRLLGFPSATNGFGEVLKPGRKRKNVSIHREALQELQLKRWKLRRRINIDQELTRLYGDQARFRGVQREAIEAVMMNKSPIVVVMGTGGGKSLGFMLPAASCPGGVTVVVVPLVSLQGDLMERCRQMRIPCAEWRSDRSPGSASLVFVTPESAMTKRFHDYIEGLRITAQLDGFVIDEAHTIMEGTKDFRPRLAELGQLALVGVQMVYFTATLPPSKEDAFFELTHIRREDVVMIRSRTTRSNVAYSVQTLPAISAEEATEMMTAGVRRLLDEKLEEYPWPAKMIVYCRTVKATDALAIELNCDAYHRDIDTRDGKAERLRAWMSGMVRERYGGGRVIVATNALGLGIDVPDIRVVVHVEMPFEMADYAQQSGRAGRDGQRSEGIVLQIAAESGVNKPVRNEEQRSMEEFVSGKICRRVAIDSVMDGRLDRESCEGGEEACDICAATRGRDGSVSSEDEVELDMRRREIDLRLMRSRVGNKVTVEAQEIELLRRRLEERLLSGCMFCNPPGRGRHDVDHMSLDCNMTKRQGGSSRKVFDMGLQMRAFIRRERAAERFGSCYECFVPQEICNRWEENEVQGGWRRLEQGECQFQGVMESTIAFVYASLPEDAEELFLRLGFIEGRGSRSLSGRIKESQVWKWMGRRIDWGGVEATNMCRVFLHMAGTDNEGNEDS